MRYIQNKEDKGKRKVSKVKDFNPITAGVSDQGLSKINLDIFFNV